MNRHMTSVQALRERWWWRLPREARDTLFMLAAIGAVLLPHLQHLPAWCTALALGVLVWRAQMALRGRPLPSRVVLLAAVALVVALTWNSHGRLSGREAGVTLLVALLALKTLELRARRDALVVFHLSFFLVLMQFLHGQRIAAAAWSLITCWALLTALVLAQMPVGRPALRLAATQAARVTLLGLPVMAALFVLFPRVGPLWGQPGPAVGRVALGQDMAFGSMSQLAEDDGIAVRLRVDEGQLPTRQLYLRGPVLTHLDADGRHWRAAPPPHASPDALADAPSSPAIPTPRGPYLRYTALVEPTRLRTLTLLDPGDEPPGARIEAPGVQAQRLATLTWHTRSPLTTQVRLTREAHLGTRHGAQTPPPDAPALLALPPGLNPRLVAWAQRLHARLGRTATAQTLSDAVLAHLRSGGYLYTLEPGRYGESTPHAVDEFWFDRKLGFCEHYAAGYVIALRAMGVPARIVTGYQGADPVPQDGWLVVRNRQAHAWAEIWAPGQGWHRVDPTAVVAPRRIEQGEPLPAVPGALARALGADPAPLLSALRRVGETLDLRWQQWVLNYSQTQQMGLLARLGWHQPDALALAQLIALTMAATLLLAVGALIWRARRRDRAAAEHRWLHAQLVHLGLAAQAHEAPLRWAHQVSERYGKRGAPLHALLLAEEARRYGTQARPSPRRALTRLRWQWRVRQATAALARPDA